MFFIKYLSRLFKVLRSGISPNQIAAGFVLGMIIGLTPFWSFHNILLIILIIITQVNISMVILGFAVFSGFAYILDYLFHNLGFWLLAESFSLRSFWTSLYNLPVVPYTQFNNTVVLGSLLISLILVIPVFFLFKKGVVLYRIKIDARMQKWKIVQAIKTSKLYVIYEKFQNLGD